MEKVAICEACKNCKEERGFLGGSHVCLVNTMMNYITGEEIQALCGDINEDGKCEKFEKKDEKIELRREVEELNKKLEFIENQNKGLKSELFYLHTHGILQFIRWKKEHDTIEYLPSLSSSARQIEFLK
jgi:hypothetical protein